MRLKLSSTIPYLLIAGLIATGCQRQRQRQQANTRPEFQNINATAANPPLSFDQIKESQSKPFNPVPPSDSGPLVRVSADGKPITGEHSYVGRIAAAANPLRFAPESQPEILIGYAFPTSLQLKATQTTDVTLYVKDQSAPDRADHIVTLRTKQELLLGYLWRVDEKPISYSPIEGVSLSQEALTQTRTENSMTPVAVFVNTNEGRKPVPEGRDFAFSVRDKKFTVFVQTSLFQTSSVPGDDTPTGYVLRAIVVEN